MGKEKLTRDEQRAAAREKAKADLAAKQKKNKLRKLFIQLGTIFGALAVVGIVLLVIFNSMKPGVAQANPANMISNGVIVEQGLKVQKSEPIPVGGAPSYPKLSEDKVSIVVYVDYLCPFCKQFELETADTVEQMIDSGKVTVEYRPVSFLSKYSAIAANASACVASFEPDKWWEANTALYEAQPDEAAAKSFSAKSSLNKVKNALRPLQLSRDASVCIEDMPYFDWAQTASVEATNSVIANTDGEKVTGTPTIIIDGKKFNGNGTADFQTAVDEALKVKGLK